MIKKYTVKLNDSTVAICEGEELANDLIWSGCHLIDCQSAIDASTGKVVVCHRCRFEPLSRDTRNIHSKELFEEVNG